jgi:iron complex outermembrane receptor protein
VIRNGGAPPVNVEAGSMIPGVPRNLLYAELRYRREPFFAQLESLSKSRVAVNDPNLEFAGGYTVFNLAAGLVQEQEGGRWKLTEFVRVENLTDRSYVGSVIVNEGNGRYYEPSPNRSLAIGAQASLSF